MKKRSKKGGFNPFESYRQYTMRKMDRDIANQKRLKLEKQIKSQNNRDKLQRRLSETPTIYDPNDVNENNAFNRFQPNNEIAPQSNDTSVNDSFGVEPEKPKEGGVRRRRKKKRTLKRIRRI